MSTNARVFLALRLPEEIARGLASDVREALGGAEARRRYRLPRPEGLHLTLYYMGDTPRAELDRLQALARAEFPRLPGPRLVLTKTGAFPRRGRERVLWMGAAGSDRAASDALASLWKTSLAVADRFGCDVASERDAPFVPHVTVARPRERRARVPDAFYDLPGGAAWEPECVELLESVSGEGPARYETLEAYALAT